VGVGLWVCAATSSPDERIDDPDPELPPVAEPGDGEWDEPPAQLPDLLTDVYLHNGTVEDLVVRIRPLAGDVDLDCDVIAENPGAWLTSPLFGLAQTWTLPATTNQPILVMAERDDQRECQAALVEIDAMPPRVLLWSTGTPPVHVVPGVGSSPEDTGELGVFADPDGGRQWKPGASFAYEVVQAPAECAAQPDGARVAFAEPLPLGRFSVEAIEAGADGCFALTLDADGDEPRDWFLCVPAEAMPLLAGDVIDIGTPALPAAVEGSWTGVEIVTVEIDGLPPRRLVVTAGDGLPAIEGLELAVVPDFDCEPELADDCGAVARPVHVSAAGDLGAVTLLPSAPVQRLQDETRAIDLALVHGQTRFALAPECSLGPDLLGHDLELVYAERPL
jgi:hypothetical protein